MTGRRMPAMAAEVTEAEASGDLGRIYGEIRQCYGAAYVSSIHRLMASEPGLLEWGWTVLRPGFLSGAIPETAWRLAGGAVTGLAPLPPLSPAALRLLGVGADDSAAIGNVCATFARVGPVNLLFGACLRRLADGAPPGGGGGRGLAPPAGWRPPPGLPAPPSMPDMAGLREDVRAVLLQLSTTLDGRGFVPGLYRILARWPGYLAHVATQLGPRFEDGAVRDACAAMRERIDGAADAVLAALPPLPTAIRPPEPETADRLVRAIAAYSRTSPQMAVFGTLLGNALPAEPQPSRA